MFRILIDEKFSGNLPTMEIEKSDIFPEWNTYFYINLKAGTGFEFNGWTIHKAALDNIETAILDSVLMHEKFMIENFSTRSDVEEYLEIDYRSFDA